ncbi:MAG: putative glycoside hydrolase [Solirubrobacteraceae bacterium]
MSADASGADTDEAHPAFETREVRFLANPQPFFLLRGHAPRRTATGHAGIRRRALFALATLLALALFLTIASPASANTSTGVVQFSRTTFNDLTNASNAAKYQFITLGFGGSQATIRSLVASIHAGDPGTRLLLYKDYTAAPSDTAGVGGCAPWNSSKPYGGIPMSWFLLNSSGTPIYNSGYAVYELDPGNQQVQQACLSSAISLAKQGGFDGVFFDSVQTSLFWANLKPSTCSSATCQSDTNWHAAMMSWITNESAGLHAQGLMSFGNIAGGCSPLFNGGPAWWDAFQQAGLDGASEESFTSGTNHLPMVTSQWKQELANEVWSEANGKYLLGNADVGANEALNVYGLGTVLLAAQGRSSWNTDSGNYTSPEYWFPEYNTALALGAPLGSYTVQSNGLYVRRFQNGGVAVNPTTSTVDDPAYGTLGPQSALILGPGSPPVKHHSAAGAPAGGAAASVGQGATAHRRGNSRGHHHRRHKHRRHHRHHRHHTMQRRLG